MTTPRNYHNYVVQLWMIRPDRSVLGIGYDRLSTIDLTDGSGLEVASQITATFRLPPDEHPDNFDLDQLTFRYMYVVQVLEDTLTQARHDVLYGPYDILTSKFNRATRMFTFTGTQNLHWEERLSVAGTRAEENIISQIATLFAAENYGAISPYNLWIDGLGRQAAHFRPTDILRTDQQMRVTQLGLMTINGLITSDLVRVKAFSELVTALERWGFTAFTLAGVSLDQSNLAVVSAPTVAFVPKFPVDGRPSYPRPEFRVPTLGGGVDIDGVVLNDGFRFFEDTDYAIPNQTNLAGDYRTRRIVNGVRNFAYSDDVEQFASGDPANGPVEYRDAYLGHALAQLEHDRIRWDMQNRYAEVSLKDVWPWPAQGDPSNPPFPLLFYLVPHQRFRALGKEWRIRSVRHSWDAASNGYVRTIDAFIWQGFFERVAASVVTA